MQVLKNYLPGLLGILVIPCSIIGQTVPDTTDSAKVPRYHINEVMVTAFQSETQLKSIPGAITVLQEPFELRPSESNLLNVFSGVPGMHVQQGVLNTSRISIRGIGTRYPYGTRKIKVLYGQIPLTNGEGDTFIDDITPEETGNIEIIRGPASSVYGSALGGTILIHPDDNRNQEGIIMYSSNAGSFGFNKNVLRFHSGIGKRDLNLNISRINSNGFRENSNYSRYTASMYSSGGFGRKSNYHVLVSFAKVFARIPSSVDSITYANNPEKAAVTWKNTKGKESYHRVYTGMGITLYPGIRSNFHLLLYASYRNGSEVRPFNLLYEGDAGIGTKAVYHASHNIFCFPAALTAGWNIYREFYNASIYENIGGVGTKGLKSSQDRQNIWQNDIFIQEEMDITNRLKLSAGINLNISGFIYKDIFSQDTADQSGDYSFLPVVSPRIGANYAVTSGLFLYTNVSHGFSLPSLSETLSPFGLINRDIRPERAWSLETGLRGYVIRNRTFVDFALYQMWVTDLIVPKRIAEDAYVGMNAGGSDHRGLELAVRNRILGKYAGNNIPHTFMVAQFNLNYTFNYFKFKDFEQDGRNFSGNYLPGVPKNQFAAEVKLEFRQGFYAYSQFRSFSGISITDDNSQYTPPYLLLDATTGYSKELLRNWFFRVSFSAYNITNTKYASMMVINAPGTPERPPRYYYPGEPVNYRVGVEVRYRLK